MQPKAIKKIKELLENAFPASHPALGDFAEIEDYIQTLELNQKSEESHTQAEEIALGEATSDDICYKVYFQGAPRNSSKESFATVVNIIKFINGEQQSIEFVKRFDLRDEEGIDSPNAYNLAVVFQSLCEIKTLIDEDKDVQSASVHIVTMCDYLSQAINKWHKTWAKNGWKKRTGQEIKHKEIWQEIHEKMQHFDSVTAHDTATQYSHEDADLMVGNEKLTEKLMLRKKTKA